MRYIKEQKKLINDAIATYFEEVPLLKFIEAARYTIYPEGHRYRSLVGLEVYKMLNGQQSKFLKSAIGIECIHHASLIFDDLPCMDNSSLRKGKPTTHIRYGENIAILGGLFLWNKGRQLIYENAREHLSNLEEVDRVELLINETIVDMIRGQELDLKKEKNYEEVLQSIYQKNKMFYLSCVLPVYLLNKRNYLSQLNKIGVDLSVGYQLFDDIRDTEGDVKITGKQTRVDVEKNTSVYRFGVHKVKQELSKRKRRIIKNIQKIQQNSKLEKIIEYILSIPS